MISIKYLSIIGLLPFIYLLGFIGLKSEPLTHKVFIYEKSNLDGSNKGQIAVYYEEEDQLESFKWHEGNQHATIVRAAMDQDHHTVRHFDVYRVDHLGNQQLSAVLDVAEDRTIKIQLGDQLQEYRYAPTQWHSYDFDFTSLGYAFRSFQPNDQAISFTILDLDLNESPPKLKDFGLVEMRFLQEEKKWSRDLLKYQIDGPGLDHRGGHIWFDKTDGFMVAFEIEKPDEPGYESGKLLLKEVLKMDKTEWTEFKVKALNSR